MSLRGRPPRQCTYPGCPYSSTRSDTLQKHLKSHCTEPGCPYLVRNEHRLNHYATEHPHIFRAHTGKTYNFTPVLYKNNGSVRDKGWPEPNGWPRKRTPEEDAANEAFLRAVKADGRHFGTAVSPTGARTRRGSFFLANKGGTRRRTRRRNRRSN